MTPAQEAKEYAAQHGFSIGAVIGAKRYFVYRTRNGVSHGDAIAEVGGYPAALNAMKRYVQEQAESAALEQAKLVHCDIVREDGTMGVFADQPVADFPFEDEASNARINKPASGSPEWFARHPWRIVCGHTLWSDAYATRSDALKAIRQRFVGQTAIRIVYVGS